MQINQEAETSLLMCRDHTMHLFLHISQISKGAMCLLNLKLGGQLSTVHDYPFWGQIVFEVDFRQKCKNSNEHSNQNLKSRYSLNKLSGDLIARYTPAAFSFIIYYESKMIVQKIIIRLCKMSVVLQSICMLNIYYSCTMCNV